MEIITINTLLSRIKKYNPNINQSKVLRAYKFAQRAHFGQKRKSGEDYISHPLQTAINLTSYNADEDTIIATLLHDVPEDTDIPLTLIKKQFGEEVCFLVKGITKLSKVYYKNNMEERQIESLKKLLIHSAKDLRVILIKLNDRLHNMQTIEFVDNQDKKIRISKETLEVYVPIANLLGLWELKSALEDLCFKVLYEEQYKELSQNLSDHQKNANIYLQKTIKKLKALAIQNNIDIVDIHGRPKNIFSIYKKLQGKNYNIKSIYDLIGVRVICKNRPDCYKMLGLIHSTFTPKPYRLKDYIALPKPNGYQSIHTTVFGYSGINTEFQIRTEEMHLEAEYGIAAHYFYKSKNSLHSKTDTTSKEQWKKRILEIKKQFNEKTYNVIDQLKLDIFEDRIFVFTPTGDVIDLPKAATCIDFAYAIHTYIGNHAFKGEINEYEVTISTALKSGDTVKIITKKDIHPEASWLDYAKTSFAKRKIKEALKKESQDIQITMGQERLAKEMYLTQNIPLDKLPHHIIKKLLQISNCQKIEELFLSIGEGRISPKELIEQTYIPHSINIYKYKNQNENGYPVAFSILCNDRVGLLSEILTIFGSLNININKASGQSLKDKKRGLIKISTKVESIEQIRQIFESISNIPGIIRVKRVTPYKTILSILGLIFLFTILLLHPLLLNIYILPNIDQQSITYKILPYSSLLIIYIFTLANEVLFRMTLPDKNKHRKIWLGSVIFSLVALGTIIAEIMIFDLQINKILFALGIIAIYTKLYLIYKSERQRIENF